MRDELKHMHDFLVKYREAYSTVLATLLSGRGKELETFHRGYLEALDFVIRQMEIVLPVETAEGERDEPAQIDQMEAS